MEFAREADGERKTFEEQLHEVLRRVDSPEGFTDRVMERAAHYKATGTRVEGGRTAKRGILLRLTRPKWHMLYAAAAVLAMTVGAVHVEHQRSEERRANLAAAQFDEAMQVTHHALDRVSANLADSQFGQVQRALENNGGAR